MSFKKGLYTKQVGNKGGSYYTNDHILTVEVMTEHNYSGDCVNNCGNKHTINYRGSRNGDDYKVNTI